MRRKLSIVVSFILILSVLTFLFTGCVPKKTTTTATNSPSTSTSDTSALEKRVSSIESVISNLQSKVGNTSNQEEIDAIIASITELQAQIDTLQSDIDTIIEDKEESKEAIKDIDPEDAIDTEIKYSRIAEVKVGKATLLIPGDPTSGIKSVGYIDGYTDVKIKLENMTQYNLEDIEIEFEVEAEVDGIEWNDAASYSSNYIDVDITGLSGDLEFSGSKGSYDNWDDISLNAGEKDSYTIRVKFRVENSNPNEVGAEVDIGFSMSVNCEDFSAST